MYNTTLGNAELGFDAFIAPDDFNHADLSGDHPVDIYVKFKELFTANSQARYIYSYSNSLNSTTHYPLTLTPTAAEYYKVGYTIGGIDVIVDVPLNGTAVTIFGDDTTTKRWVCVYRVSTVKFSLDLNTQLIRSLWFYCGNFINDFKTAVNNTYYVKYVHFANLNTIIGSFSIYGFYNSYAPQLQGRANIPETISTMGNWYFFNTPLVTKINLPNSKNVSFSSDLVWATFRDVSRYTDFNFGASTTLTVFNSAEQNAYSKLSVISVSSQNTMYRSYSGCDIIYSKIGDTLVWLAPKTVRGIYLPDALPQAQLDGITTKLSTNVLANFPLYIGALITDIANLYVNTANKKFSTVECSESNTAFSCEVVKDINNIITNSILYDKNKTKLIKAGTKSTDLLTIPNTVLEIELSAFNGCSGLTSLTLSNSITTLVANTFAGLTGLTSLTFTGLPTSIASDSGLIQLVNLTSIVLPVGWNLSVWNYFGFANFTKASIEAAIVNCASGTVGAPKYFYVKQSVYDQLSATAISDAAARYINVSAVVIQSGLKLWLDAANPLSYIGSGTAWNDLSGNANNGTLVNGVAYNSANGGVMSFDGVDDKVVLPQQTLRNMLNGTNGITLSCWINKNTTKTTAEEIVFIPIAGNTLVSIEISNNVLGCGARSIATDSYQAAHTPFIWLNSFINIVSVVDYTAKTIKIYVNNVLVSTLNNAAFGSTSVVLGATLLNSQLGALESSNIYFAGQLNEALIYNRALTAAEIANNFNVSRNKYGI